MICNKCGAEIYENSVICENCGASMEQAKTPVENVGLGVVGALIGGLIGAAAIILLSQLGVYAAIGGFALAFCSLKGYELLAKGMSIKGIVIAVIIMAVTPFVADALDWGIVIYNDFVSSGYELTYIDALTMLPLLLEEGAIEMSDYIKNLLMLYGFTALGK